MKRALMLILAGAVVPSAFAADTPIRIVATPYIDPELAPVAVEGRMVTVAGTIEGAKPGDDVVIEARRCTRGATFRAVGAAEATGDGVFRAQLPAYTGTFFRARFATATSPTATVRWPAPLSVRTSREYGALKIRAQIRITDPPQSFRGRLVELQRLVEGKWVRITRQRLERVSPFNFRADFTVWVRGLSVRIVLPDSGARPCYARAASRTLRS